MTMRVLIIVMPRKLFTPLAALISSPIAWFVDSPGAHAQAIPNGFYQSQTSLVVPYIDGSLNSRNPDGTFSNQAATLKISVAGSKPEAVTMDTGSTGIAISNQIVTPSLLNAARAVKIGPGAINYDSSGNTPTGDFYHVPVSILDGKNSATKEHAVGTTKVTVLVVTNDEPGKPTRYMGIGNNRNNVYSGTFTQCQPPVTFKECIEQPQNLGKITQIPASGMNPFIDVSINDTPLPNQGYVVMNDKVVIGLTSDNNNYTFIKLNKDPDGKELWDPIPMTISVPGKASEVGNILPDTGIGYAFMNPHNSEPGTVEVYLPGISQQQQVAFYSFDNVPGSDCDTNNKSNAMQPCLVKGGTSGTGFLNSGRQFYSGFNYLFDPVNGYAGFAPLSDSTLKTTAKIISQLALTGSVDMSGLSIGLPVALFGPTTLTTAPGSTTAFNAQVQGSGNNLTLNGGGTVSFNAAVNLGSGTFNLQQGAATITAGLTAGTLTVGSQGTLTNPTGSTISVQNFILNGRYVGDLIHSGKHSGNGEVIGNFTNSGTIAPGNSIGTLTINGNYAQLGGNIDAEIQGPQNDRIDVTGNVTNFTGTANLIPFGGGSPYPGFVYTIISAPNSVDFAAANSLTLLQPQVTSALLNTGSTLVQHPLGDRKSFAVQWQPNNARGAVSSAMQALGNGGANTSSTADALDRAFNGLASRAGGNANNTGTPIGTTGFTTGQTAAAGITPGFLEALNNLVQLPSTSQLVAAVNSLSPQPYAAFQSVGLDTLRQQREAVLAQAGQCLNNGWIINGPTAKNPLCAFGLAQSDTGSIRGTSDRSSYNSGVFFSGIGLEYYPSSQWSFGGSYSYGTSYANNFAAAAATVTAGVNNLNLFTTFAASDQWRVRGLLGYSNFNVYGSRSIAFIGNGSSLTANPNANGFTAAIETDYAIPLTKPAAQTQVLLKPLLGLAWGAYQQSGFSESGGPLSLSVNSNTANSLVTTAGLELSTSPIPLNKQKSVSIRPNLLIAYQVDALANNSSSTSLQSTFTDASGICSQCSTQGQNLGTSALNLAGAVDFQVSQFTSFYVNASYRATSNASQFGYGGGIRVRF